MEKNKAFTIILMLILVLILGFSIYKGLNKNQVEDTSREEKNVSSVSNEDIKLISILKKSPFFTDSKINLDDKKETLTIDNKYIINIKNGFYTMNIDDQKLEKGYCEIVDAIEADLGNEVGKSIETCEKTLSGSISLGGISVEIYDSYKVLSVNANEPAKLYNIINEHKEKDQIPIEEVNYNIQIGNSLFTSMSADFKEEAKNFAVCGHIYDEKKKSKDFLIKIYDSNKNFLAGKIFEYRNDKKKYLSFCVNYDMTSDIAKYFSIEERK